MLKALILCLSKSACIPQSATALYMTGKEAGKPQIMPAFAQLSPFSWMFKMLVFFWAARRLAVLSMQNEIRISLFICPFSGSASPADALLQIGGYSSAW
jgi:hypothetical protein